MILKMSCIETSVVFVSALAFLSQLGVMAYNVSTGTGFIMRQGFLGFYAFAGGFLVIVSYGCLMVILWILWPSKYKEGSFL